MQVGKFTGAQGQTNADAEDETAESVTRGRFGNDWMKAEQVMT